MTMVFKNKALTIFYKSSFNFGWNLSHSLINSWATFYCSKQLICGSQYLHLNHINPTYPADFYHWKLGINSIRISNLNQLLERVACIYDCSVSTLFWKVLMKYSNVWGFFWVGFFCVCGFLLFVCLFRFIFFWFLRTRIITSNFFFLFSLCRIVCVQVRMKMNTSYLFHSSVNFQAVGGLNKKFPSEFSALCFIPGYFIKG